MLLQQQWESSDPVDYTETQGSCHLFESTFTGHIQSRVQCHGHTPLSDHTVEAVAKDSFKSPRQVRTLSCPSSPRLVSYPIFPSLACCCYCPQLTRGGRQLHSYSCPTATRQLEEQGAPVWSAWMVPASLGPDSLSRNPPITSFVPSSHDVQLWAEGEERGTAEHRGEGMGCESTRGVEYLLY